MIHVEQNKITLEGNRSDLICESLGATCNILRAVEQDFGRQEMLDDLQFLMTHYVNILENVKNGSSIYEAYKKAVLFDFFTRGVKE